jgi:hypothetical protein
VRVPRRIRTISEYVAIGWFAWLSAIFWTASNGTESTAPGRPQKPPHITSPARIAIGVIFRVDPNITGSRTCFRRKAFHVRCVFEHLMTTLANTHPECVRYQRILGLWQDQSALPPVYPCRYEMRRYGRSVQRSDCSMLPIGQQQPSTSDAQTGSTVHAENNVCATFCHVCRFGSTTTSGRGKAMAIMEPTLGI